MNRAQTLFASNNKNFPYYNKIKCLQEELSNKVVTSDCFTRPIRYVCGVDVSYRNDVGYCSAVILRKDTNEVLESVNVKCKVNYPYIPSLFLLREYEPILAALNLLSNDYDLLLIDGNGQLHPKKCGLACSVGITTSKPTIGIAKSLLCGTIKVDHSIELGGQILGMVVEKILGQPVYVSVGNKISLKSAEKLVRELIVGRQHIPEPLLVAHINSRKFANKRQITNS